MSVFASVWSFILTLVRSLLALFSWRRRAASDPFSLPSLNRNPGDALARAHSRLRPILLTPRSIAVSPRRAHSVRSHSAASTLLPAHVDDPSPSAPQACQPQRTSPKLDPHDAELGLSITPPEEVLATSFRDWSHDTSGAGTLYVLPLTPPDRCYLAPLPSDYPYTVTTESWPANATDHGKPRLPGSPLRLSVNMGPPFPEPMVAPIGSPPPGRWSPVHIWTSTPCKIDNDALTSDCHDDHSSALVNISHAIISRSQSSTRPYDDMSLSSIAPDTSPFGLTRDRRRTHTRKVQPFLRFHHPDAYTCSWRRLPTRLPGRSPAHTDTNDSPSEWYDADAYAASPRGVLSPPNCDSSTDEDEDEMPLSHLRERLTRRCLGLGVVVPMVPAEPDAHKASRRMSDGCLLALSEETPTRVTIGARAGRQALSMILDGDGYGTKDWLDALSLRFSSEREAEPEPSVDVASV